MRTCWFSKLNSLFDRAVVLLLIYAVTQLIFTKYFIPIERVPGKKP